MAELSSDDEDAFLRAIGDDPDDETRRSRRDKTE
jgi:hypothetical protein